MSYSDINYFINVYPHTFPQRTITTSRVNPVTPMRPTVTCMRPAPRCRSAPYLLLPTHVRRSGAPCMQCMHHLLPCPACVECDPTHQNRQNSNLSPLNGEMPARSGLRVVPPGVRGGCSLYCLPRLTGGSDARTRRHVRPNGLDRETVMQTMLRMLGMI